MALSRQGRGGAQSASDPVRRLAMTQENAGLIRLGARQEIVLWLSIASILTAAIGFSWNPTPLAQVLAAIFIACALVHATFAYGARRALILFVVCSAIAFTMENLGTATGFPFGVYHFEVGSGLPHVGLIPIIVGPLWFGAG